MLLEAKGVAKVLGGIAPVAKVEKAKFDEKEWISKAFLVGFLTASASETSERRRPQKHVEQFGNEVKKSVTSQTIIRKQLTHLRMKEDERI